MGINHKEMDLREKIPSRKMKKDHTRRGMKFCTSRTYDDSGVFDQDEPHGVGFSIFVGNAQNMEGQVLKVTRFFNPSIICVFF